MSDIFYVMVDHPKYRNEKKRWCRPFTNIPTHPHQTIESAKTEAERLAKKMNAPAIVMKVESIVMPILEV